MAYLDNNGVLYLWGKFKAFVSSAVAGLYTKPSGGIPDSDIASAATWNAKYTKPASGIPASDLASGVIPTVPQMAVYTNMQDWTEGKVVDALTLRTVVAGAAQQVAAKADASSVYTKTEIDGKLTNAYVYKGSVATVSDLPSSGAENGWVYNVDASGMNYAWNGSAWDALGETFTITAITNAEIDAICT